MIDRLIGDSEALRAVFELLASTWPYVATALHFGIAIVASAHVVLYKRDVRASIAWAGLIWLSPFVGAALYVLFGINRIRRRASRLRSDDAGVELFGEGAVLMPPKHRAPPTPPTPPTRAPVSTTGSRRCAAFSTRCPAIRRRSATG